MVAVGLLLRFIVMGFAYEIPLDPARDHFSFAYEMGRVARSIATGQGFSSPYPEPTGPTAAQAPLYPYLLAGVFRLFGIYSTASAIVMLSLNHIFSALTCVPLFLIARRVIGSRVAVWVGWTWAFFPYAISISSRWIWETSLTTLLLTWLVLMTLRLEQTRRLAPWLGYGALWGLACLSNPSVLSSLPFLCAWLWFRHWRRGTNCTGPMLASAMLFLAIVSIWLVRDYRTFGEFVFFRDNFPLEFHLGNNEDSSKPKAIALNPAANPAESEKIRRIGEMAYMKEKRQLMRDFLSQQPGRFVWLTLRRILLTWTGVWSGQIRWVVNSEQGVPNIFFCSLLSLLAFWGLGRAMKDGLWGAVPLMIVMLCFPLVFYVTHPSIRYRHPIDPQVALFAVYGAAGIFRRRDSAPQLQVADEAQLSEEAEVEPVCR